MKFSASKLLLALVASPAYGADTSDVVDLTTDTFAKHVGSHALVLAEFFAPWCGHCKNLAPEYEQAATELKSHPEDISLVKVDCMENQDLCQEHKVQGFPTLLIFEDGESSGNYNGQRKADDITKFMLKRSAPVVTTVEDQAALDKWLTENQDSNEVTFLYLGPEEHAESYRKTAQQNRERLAFLSSADAKLRKQLGGDLVVLKKDEAPAALSPSTTLSAEAIAEFVKEEEFPSFGEVGPLTYSAYISNGSPMLYAFVEDEAARNLVKKAVTPLLPQLKGKANVVFLDASMYGMHAENVNLRPEFPAMVVHDTVSNKKYIHSQDVALSEKSIPEFINQYLAGEIPADSKSEPIPETQEGPVYVLVGKEYDDVVLNNDQDVLVEFYAPWCGHCKNLAPHYEELAQLYENSDKVVIAKLDHTQNEVPDQIAGYPTIKLYPAGKKDEPITFEGSRTVKDFAKFIKEKGTHKIDVEDLKKAAPEKEKKSAKESVAKDSVAKEDIAGESSDETKDEL